MINKNFSKKDIKKKIKLPTKLTPLLAEICGIHIGDGHLGFRKNKPEYLIQCMGNNKNDRNHYNKFMVPAWKKLFNIKLNVRRFPSNTYGFRVYSKGIASFFNEFLEMPFGNKTKTIGIPNIIKKTCHNKISKEMIACLRGIIDTDFYFVYDRGCPILGAWFASRNLVVDISKYFNLLNINHKIKLDIEYYNTSSKKYLIRHQIRIRKKDDIYKWMNIIGTNNQKIYKRCKRLINAPIAGAYCSKAYKSLARVV